MPTACSNTGHLIVRADATAAIGSGHIMRCIALAQAWQDQGGKVTFLSRCESDHLQQRIHSEGYDFVAVEKPHPDPSDLEQILLFRKCSGQYGTPDESRHWIILDGYHFTPGYQKSIREAGLSLLVIDDMNHLPCYHADILLNQNIHARQTSYSCDRDTVQLLGCEYTLLRKEFLRYKDRKPDIPDKAKNILVTMGGADPDNVTLKVIDAVALLDDSDVQVKIVVGPANPHIDTLKNAFRNAPPSRLNRKQAGRTKHLVRNATNMPELMAWADIAVSAGGSTCWEMAFMGLPSLIITLADNQAAIAEGLAKAGASIDLGWHAGFSIKQCSQTLKELLRDKKRRSCFSERGQQLINGNGKQKIINAMHSGQIKLRRAQGNDCKLLWKWANDPDTRKVSFSSGPISWKDHTSWFNSMLNSTDCMMYVATMNDGTPLGQIRYDIKQEGAVVSISIDSKFRSKGYGSVLIREASRRLFDTSNIRRVHAYVKPNNNASVNVFTKTGFKKLELTTIHAQQVIHFVLERFRS